MTDLSLSDVVEQLTAILDEAFEHPPRAWSYFTDPSPDAGYFGLLAKLGAAEAGRSVGGSSIAAQVRHVIFATEASIAFMEGEPEAPGLEAWQLSWQVPEVDEAAWTQMQAELRAVYERLRRVIASRATTNARSAGGAIAVIAHVAYHLGAIKQKAAVIRGAE